MILCSASLALTLATTAQAETATEKFAADRLALFGKGDIAGLMAQYADEATVITPQGALQGSDQIGAMIMAIVGEFAQPGVTFNLISQVSSGDVVAFTWSAETLVNSYKLGAETYVIKDGKIEYQTFAANVSPR